MKHIAFRIALSAGLWLAIVASGHAQTAPAKPRLENFDHRAELARKEPGKTPERAAAQTVLEEQVPSLQVDFDPSFGTVKNVRANLGFLTGPNGQGLAVSPQSAAAVAADDPYRSIKAFLNEHQNLFGHGAELIPNARVSREFVTAHSGMKTIVWEQQVDGIPVFESILIGHVTRNGELVNLSSQFLPDREQAADLGVPNRAALQAAPPISARQAVMLAAGVVGETMTLDQVTAQGEVRPGPEQLQRFSAAALPGGVDAKLLWVPMNRTVLRLCWDLLLTSRSRGEMFRVLVDAQTGDVVIRRGLTDYLSDASYRVFTSDSPSPFSPGHPVPSQVQPPVINRTLVVTNAISVLASPNGWINDGDNETRGNNVDAHADRNGDNQPDLPRPQGNPNRVFDFPLDLAQDPTNSSSASIVQLFYWNNFIHDKLYELGFTEAAGNFQVDNFGRGGLGNDAVSADGQDGGGFDNANMGTPPDGFAPRMQMYLFDFTTPYRDGSLDAEVVLHEYTHGLSNRRVGQGVLISELQTAGMGEGWSDFYGLSLLSESGDNVDGNYAVGGYVTYQFFGLLENYYFGIRRYPYTTDMSKDPLTFKDIDPSQALPHTGVPRSPWFGPFDPRDANEVHNQGEVWCVMLWEVRANLVKKLGWAIGNQLMLQLVTDGMNLAPANPNFVQSRDSILQADQVATRGANYGEIWAGFAKRGLGASATSPDSSTTTGVVEAYDLPGLTFKRANTDDSLTGNGNGAIDPNECNKLSIFLGNGGLTPATNIFSTLTSTNPEVTITQSTSRYADLSGGGIGAGLVPFEIYTSPDLQCGRPLAFVLTVTSSRGTNVFKFRLDTGLAGAAIRFSSDVTVPIADLSSNNSPISVSGVTNRLAKVAVSLHVKHTADVDLVLWLEAPDGTRVTLSSRNGGRGDNYGTSCSPGSARTTFEDRSSKPVASGTAPFVGTYRPDQPLVAYVGKIGAAVNGIWRLHVDDLDLADTGTLECWTLSLYPVVCADGGGNCATDLAVSVGDAPDPVIVGSNLTYTAIVSNLRPNSASSVVFTDILPPNASFLSATSSQGSCSQTGGKVTCNLGTVNYGSPVTITMVAKPTATGSLTNSAAVTTSSAEVSTANNSAISMTTAVAPVPSLIAAGSTLIAESMVPATGGIEAGEEVTFNLAIRNVGGADTGIVWGTLLPGNGVASPSGPQSFGALNAGGAAVSSAFTFTANPDSGGTVVASLQLNDGSDLGIVTYTYHVGASAVFGNTTPIVIPTQGAASPYPSTIQVSGVHGLVSKVTVNFTKFSHAFPDDLDILLVGPGGQRVLLMSDCGGNNSLTNVSFTLDDSAAGNLPDIGRLTPGVFRPTDYEAGDFFPAPAPAGASGTSLATLNGIDPNGTWSLYVVDDSQGDGGVISGSWKLNISTVDPLKPVSNLSLSALSSPADVVRGDFLTYTATVVNHGPDAATGVVVTNALPPGLTFFSASASSGSCQNAQGIVTCNLGTLGSGASNVVTIVAVPEEAGLVANALGVSGNEIDLNLGNNTATVVSPVRIPVSDLVVFVADRPDPVSRQSSLVYTITVTNKGPDISRFLILEDALPAGVAYVSAGSSQGTCDQENGVVSCSLGDLATGTNATITIVVTPGATGFITNQVTVAGVASDPNLANNTVRSRTTVNEPVAIIVAAGSSLVRESLVPTNNAIEPGETVTLSFGLLNVGSVAANNLVATLLPGEGVSGPSEPQTYGALASGGPLATRPFSFTANAASGAPLNARLRLRDGANDLGTVTFAFTLSTVQSGTNSASLHIPEAGPASVYPSIITISGFEGAVSKVTVGLLNLSHTFPEDLDVLLVSPTGRKILLMSDAGGGNRIDHVNLTFDDGVSNSLPALGQIVSGAFKPSSYEPGDPFPAPAPAAPYETTLANLSGEDPNGNWSLYVVDDAGGDSGSLAGGWWLSIAEIQPLTAHADLDLVVVPPSSPVFTGSSLRYLITITNRGPALATGVMLTNTLPEGVESWTAVPTPATGSCTFVNGQIVCDLGNLISGNGAVVQIDAIIGTAGTKTNLSTVGGAQDDPNLANNGASVELSVISNFTVELGATASDGLFYLYIYGGLGATVVIEGSTDLFNPGAWVPIEIVMLGPGVTIRQYADPANFEKRFYRVRLAP